MPSENTSAAWRAFYAHPDYDPHNASFRNLITAVVRAEHEARSRAGRGQATGVD